jgi:hypothetical protein
MRSDPATLAEAVGWFIERGEGRDEAFTMVTSTFLDAFYTAPDRAVQQAMIDDEPALTGDERRDAYVGAIGEHLARRWGLAIPGWAAGADRQVAEPWFVGAMGVGLSGLLLVESPIAFRRRRIFTEAEPLRRARMPVAEPAPRPGEDRKPA